ncbi:MAG: oligosaccharide flippase family protein [Candidatus Levybacteria bacterium]|nr:oligosaccharide flippase family protein [Candidatus Levybacteria bacterium]
MLLKRQTNILSAAFVIMATVVLSQILGVLRERLLVSIFGATTTLGLYNYSYLLPDTIFQLTIAAAFSSAFIPVFSEYLGKGKEEEAQKIASTLLALGLSIFLILSLLLAIFAPQVLSIFNLGSQFTESQIILMANLMRIVIFGQILFIIGTFFTALLQSYNHFFIPGIAAACYNLGIIIGVLIFSPLAGIYAAPMGVILGALIFVLVQLPLAKRVGFSFLPERKYIFSDGIKKIIRLMWPRTLQTTIFQFGTLAVAILIGFLSDPARMKLLFDYAKTLAFAPVTLFGISIAQAAFPILSREKDNMSDFKSTFLSSFNQMLYIILPASAIILVLRVPIVRLAYGADAFDWNATLLTGRTLAFLSLSIFAQALIQLVNRGFYALQSAKTPLFVGIFTTTILIVLTYVFVVVNHMGLETVALAFTISSILQLGILFILLDYRTGGFPKKELVLTGLKFFFATLFTGFALYIPIKLLDQLVFDTTRTINLIILTGISSMAGLSLYLFLSWLFNIKEASTYILLFKKVGNWREILNKTDEVIDGTRINP